MKGFTEFEFDLPDALLASLVRVFDGMEPASLVPRNVGEIPDAQGVYQLLLGDHVVYIGKTDAESGLRGRLERHARTIQHRVKLDPVNVLFKAVRVFVFTAMDLETQLIRHYGGARSVPWNSSGFGSNDPGRERDTTNLGPAHFDVLYPIDLDREIDIDLPLSAKAGDIIKMLRTKLPYIFRVEGVGPPMRQFHPDLLAADVAVPPAPYTTRALVVAIVQALPPGWQATALAGRVIMYREQRDYASGSVIARS